MKYFVAVTDNDWFKYLSLIHPDEVNFWRPSGKLFRAVDTGAPFLFKLHSPSDFIVGGGSLVRSYRLPLSLAWDAFQQKNGAVDFLSFLSMIRSHRSHREGDKEIGCIILNNPFFFPEDFWIPAPDSWKRNIVVGKTYDTAEIEGRKLWEKVLTNLSMIQVDNTNSEQPGIGLEEGARYGKDYLAKARLGQGTFRILVTNAYHKSCAITGERTLPVLQASHIKPFSKDGPNTTNNGLLLRSDLHILFDLEYITITPDSRVQVSIKIKERFHNGRQYYSFHGQKILNLPDLYEDRPSKGFIRWHNEQVYVAY